MNDNSLDLEELIVRRLKAKLDQLIEEEISRIKEQRSLQDHVYTPPVYPNFPTPVPPNLYGKRYTCSRCGLDFEGLTGYHCSDPQCMMQLKVTFTPWQHTSSQT